MQGATTLAKGATDPGKGRDDAGAALGASSPGRRHHVWRWVLLAVLVVVAGGIAVFAGLWLNSGAHELPLSSAYQHFTPDAPPAKYRHEALRPPQGVYPYAGSGTEHVSLPPKTQYEGPIIPGTVTYLHDGCWDFRLDYSDSHWQSSTYCPKGAELLLDARAGWYRWDFVAVVIADTATYRCSRREVILPARGATGTRQHFSCTGRNDHLSIPPVTMSGWTQVLRTGTVDVAGRAEPAVEVRELATFSGGQSGTNDSSTWYAASTGLPLEGTWRTEVRTASPVGTSTLTASGRFHLQAGTPRS